MPRFGPLSFSADSHCASRTPGGLGAWQSPTASPGFRLSQSSLRVRSATAVICGIIIALDSSEPCFREVFSSTVKRASYTSILSYTTRLFLGFRKQNSVPGIQFGTTILPPPLCISYALVQATIGVGNVLIWYLILIRYQT